MRKLIFLEANLTILQDKKSSFLMKGILFFKHSLQVSPTANFFIKSTKVGILANFTYWDWKEVDWKMFPLIGEVHWLPGERLYLKLI